MDLALVREISMVAISKPPIHYPSGDGQPVAETFDHVYVILITIAVLRQYLQDEQACILGNQYLYYAQGLPKLRCAPDVMVIFGVAQGGRDNYKIWEEGQIPRVVFEMTSPGTKKEDDGFKKQLYEQIGIEEYWQFDPKGEWISEKLRGFRLIRDEYVPIEFSPAQRMQSQALGLWLEVDGTLISFYRSDTGEKLLIPDELYERSKLLQAKSEAFEAELKAERSANEVLQQQLQESQTQIDRYRDRFGDL
jgi:Uma2 family endonuclease